MADKTEEPKSPNGCDSEIFMQTISASSMEKTKGEIQFLTIDQPPLEQTIETESMDTLDQKAYSEKKKSERTIPDANSLFEAMPLLSKHTRILGGDESNHVFRH